MKAEQRLQLKFFVESDENTANGGKFPITSKLIEKENDMNANNCAS